MPLHRLPSFAAQRVQVPDIIRAERVGDVPQHVAVALIPEKMIDLLRDQCGEFVLSGSAQREYVQTIHIQALASGTEQILPVGAFLHADKSDWQDLFCTRGK